VSGAPELPCRNWGDECPCCSTGCKRWWCPRCQQHRVWRSSAWSPHRTDRLLIRRNRLNLPGSSTTPRSGVRHGGPALPGRLPPSRLKGHDRSSWPLSCDRIEHGGSSGVANTGSSEITKGRTSGTAAFTVTAKRRSSRNARILRTPPDDDVRTPDPNAGLAFLPPGGHAAELPNDKKQEPEPGITLTTLRQTVRDRLYGKGGGANSRGVRAQREFRARPPAAVQAGRGCSSNPDGHSGSVTKGVYRFSGRLHEPGLIRDARIERKGDAARITRGGLRSGSPRCVLLGSSLRRADPRWLWTAGSGELTVVGYHRVHADNADAGGAVQNCLLGRGDHHAGNRQRSRGSVRWPRSSRPRRMAWSPSRTASRTAGDRVTR